MLSLDSPRWASLNHAYGNAADIPALLHELEKLPASSGNAEPWFSIWSSLAHQGDVHSASFAAVPHIIRILSTDPVRADSSFLQFPAWIEICRQKNGETVPEDLSESYFAALNKLPDLIARAAGKEWDDGYLACALAALAVAKGRGSIGEAAMELCDDDTAERFLAWKSAS
jgi:hypothetical protein